MTTRRFLMWYLGAVIFVGATGVSAWHALSRLHATTQTAPVVQVAVAEADVPPPQAAIIPTQPAMEPAATPALPKLRPHVVTTNRPVASERKRTASLHPPAHRAGPADGPWAYRPPPPPPPPGYYAYPARYPYPDYYPYYPRYGYYRTF